jgi:hypothetical protein
MGKTAKKFIQPYIKIRQLEYDNPMEKYLKSQSFIGRLKKVFEYFE